ncbi:hypothetical protein YC2023_104503 [Brassica napus]
MQVALPLLKDDMSMLFPGWSVRSNVVEYEHNYVVAVELPRASINYTRVEVDKHKDDVSAEFMLVETPQSNIMNIDWVLASAHLTSTGFRPVTS